MSNIDVSDIEGVRLVQAVTSSDSRGRFIKFHPENFLYDKLDSVAVSINPKAGTIRGIHLQIEPFAEEKIVTCLQGSTFEVIIDIRPKSKNFSIKNFLSNQISGLYSYGSQRIFGAYCKS